MGSWNLGLVLRFGDQHIFKLFEEEYPSFVRPPLAGETHQCLARFTAPAVGECQIWYTIVLRAIASSLVVGSRTARCIMYENLREWPAAMDSRLHGKLASSCRK